MLFVAALFLAGAPIFAQDPVPLINQPLVPDTAAPGGAQFTLTVNGTGFVSGATVDWDGAALTTTFVSNSRLTATVPAARIASAGTASVTVVNPSGETSNVVLFPVTTSSSTVSFSDATGSPITVPGQATSIAVADFDGDGNMDLAVSNNTATSEALTILLDTNGNGTLTEATGSPISVGLTAGAVTAGDFNGDGQADLAVQTTSSTTFTPQVTILLGNGDGTFNALSNPPAAPGGDSVAAADLDGDGILDLVLNSSGPSLTILLGNGDGSFADSTPITVTTSDTPTRVEFGDLDGDGNLDLVAADPFDGEMTILLGHGDGTFGSPTYIPSGGGATYSYNFALADLDGDGKLDLAIPNLGNSLTTPQLTILLGNGDGTFGSPTSFATGNNPYSATVADFNGDFKPDLAVADEADNDVTIFLGNGDGTFTPLSSKPLTGTSPEGVAVADFNGDGRIEMATPNTGNNTTSVLLQSAPSAPGFSPSAANLDFGSLAVGTTTGEVSLTVTNTGNADLIFGAGAVTLSGTNAADFTITTDTCTGQTVAPSSTCMVGATFSPSIAGTETASLGFVDNAASSPQSVALSGEGVAAMAVVSLAPSSLDFGNQVAGTSSSAQTVTLTNTGTSPLTINSITTSNADFTESDNCPAMLGPSGNCSIDVTFAPSATGASAGTLDIADDAANSPQTVTLTGTGVSSGTTNPVPLINQPLVPDTVAPGGAQFTLTVNGANFVSGATIHWGATQLTTTFVSSSQVTAAVPAADIAAAGTASVTVVNPGGKTSNVVFFPVAASETAPSYTDAGGSPVSISPQTQPLGATVGDFNADGVPDLAVTNPSLSPLTIFLGTGGGSFTVSSPSVTGGTEAPPAVGDFDGDGNLDLAVSNENGNSVNILLGDGSGTFTVASSPATGASPVWMVVADFNADGNLDLAVANNADATLTILLGNGDGTFTATSASPATDSGPRSVATADFDGDGNLDLAVATVGGKDVSILLGNGDGTFTDGGTTSSLGGRTGSVIAADLDGDSIADLAVVNLDLDAVDILLGKGDGTFGSPTTFATGDFPHVMAAADLNADGKLDLVVTNSFSNDVSVLLGNGDGTFTATASPVAVGGGPSSVAVGDFNADGRFDLAVSNQSDNTVSILLHQAAAPAPAVTFPGGNSLDFGNQTPGTTSAEMTVTLTNSGTADLSVSTVAIGGADAADYAVTSDTCTGATVAAGSTCSVGVTFTPSSTGSETASLNFTDDAANSPQSVALMGVGSSSAVNLSPSSLDFGSQALGTASTEMSVTLTNSGTADLNVSTVAIAGADAADYAFGSDTCTGATVAAGGTCSVGVTFTPSVARSETASLNFTDDAANSPQSVPLVGIGSASDFTLTPRSTSLTIASGGYSSFDLLVSPEGGFNQSVDLACSGAPQGATCMVTPTSVTLDGTHAASFAVKVTTTGNAMVGPGPGNLVPPSGSLPLAAWLAILGLLVLMAVTKLSPERGRVKRLAPYAAVALLVTLWAGCGGGSSSMSTNSSNTTPSGTYTLQVTGTSGNLSHSTSITLKVL